jgi:hypothetical protein
MTYRPYPNVDRALAQVARRRPPAPIVELECLRPMSESFARLRENTQRAAEQGFGVDEYRLSSR